MSDQEVLQKIRSSWVAEKDASTRNYWLASIAQRLHPERLKIVPATQIPNSKWLSTQQVLLDTHASKKLRVGGLCMFAVYAAMAWLVFLSPLKWYAGLLVAIVIFALSTKAVLALRRSAIVSGAIESAFVYDRLWKSQAFALQLDGKLYEPLGANAWQDVVFLALGLEDLVDRKPLSREEMVTEILRPTHK